MEPELVARIQWLFQLRRCRHTIMEYTSIYFLHRILAALELTSTVCLTRTRFSGRMSTYVLQVRPTPTLTYLPIRKYTLGEELRDLLQLGKSAYVYSF